MPSDSSRHERDLILAPNEYAFILDETKGNVINYVGPHKTSLANTDQPVTFNDETKRFERCNLEQAIQAFAIAPEGWYIVLKNPPQDGKPPKTGAANNLPDLNIGRKVNIPGPVSFAPWPGQMVRVLQGHRLRSNQYLLVRVYDEEAARLNWGKAVIKPQTSGEKAEPQPTESADVPDLTMGKLLVIKGTEVSFYIPPTGVEVVRDESGDYVRQAVTLERLEYCILLDEDGNKRYIIGPAVVFPKPTETFIDKHNSRKFKAIELNEISGLYIKVIAPYEENGQQYKVGEELFITGKDQMIYFPRPEHAIVRYGSDEVNYAVAIPAGEARYVLDRLSGQIILARGPAMFLPDPRRQVIVRRVLEPRLVEMWFPGNQEAQEYNRRMMAGTKRERGEEFVRDQDAREILQSKSLPQKIKAPAAPEEFAGDEFNRRQSFSQPRTITLDTKYEGAVTINVWTGYAVQVVSKTGQRKVIVGPQTYLLEYDELLESLELSTGTPKTDEKLFKTVYLRVLHNKVSDIVEAETRDFCPVQVRLSYRVNFDGAPEKWFNVENYVKFLTEHMRSLLRYAMRTYSTEEFYTNATRIIRDTILGTPGENNKRAGRNFEENGMHIYDVEVLDVAILDKTISGLLINSQRAAVQQTLELAAEQRNLDATEQKEKMKQKAAEAESATKSLLVDLRQVEVQKQLELNLSQIEANAKSSRQKLDSQWAEQGVLDQISTAELARKKASMEQELDVARQRMLQEIEILRADVEATVNKAGAVSPQLIAALQAFSDRALAERMATSMAPLSILGGKSVADVFSQLLKGTVLEKVLASASPENKPADEPAKPA